MDEGMDEIDPAVLQRVMRRVLEAEQDKLYMKTPRGINQDIRRIIEDEIE